VKFAEWEHYSIARDARVSRVMMWDAGGQEYFAVVERGRGYRERCA